jgi:hypothetical protein
MVKEDNRHVLSAKVEKLEAQVARLQKALSDKEEQEQVMVQVGVFFIRLCRGVTCHLFTWFKLF